MGKIHRLLTEKGKQGVLDLNLFDRPVVETGASYMSAEGDTEIQFLYSGFAQAALPHRKLDDAATWQVRTDRATLLVQPGMRPSAEGDPIPVGVPYGSRARLICLYLQSTARRTRSREIELGRSLTDWLNRMGIPVGGKSHQQVRDQAERIARCRMSFQIQQGPQVGLVNQSIVDTALFLEEEASGQFLQQARLSESFYEQLVRHSVPVEERAIVALSNNSVAMDVYCWLAYRLHALKEKTPVSWKALHRQFGTGVARTCDFKPAFKANLQLAISVYPDAKVDVEDTGLVLFPSRAPVEPKIVSLALARPLHRVMASRA